MLEALEQWKALLLLLTRCDAALESRPRLYAEFARTLREQLTYAPADFFADELSADNFLRDALGALSLRASEAADALGAELATELELLWALVHDRFRLERAELESAHLGDDVQPVIVSVS